MKIRMKDTHSKTTDRAKYENDHFFYVITELGALLYWFKSEWELVQPKSEWKDAMNTVYVNAQCKSQLLSLPTRTARVLSSLPDDYEWRTGYAYIVPEDMIEEFMFKWRVTVLRIFREKE